MITLTGIGKRFAGVTALEGVSLTFAAGQVHGLLGENGAGKSTLMNILFGMLQPDAGTIAIDGIDGVVTRIRSPRAACRLGIGMVHQHFKLVPTLSVVDNLALALDASFGRVDRTVWRARIHQRAAALRWTVDADARIENLSVGQQQRVEILKALLAIEASGAKNRTLILDEPTAVLAPQEIDELLSAVRALAADGVAVVYISHKLAEIASVCTVVSVLRRGRLVHQGPANESPERLAELMIGSVTARSSRTAQPATAESPARITLDGVTVITDGRTLLQQVSLVVRAGEIVGIAGVEGNGQLPLVQAILGQLLPDQGRVALSVQRDHIGVIPEDRQREALVMPLSVNENLALKSYRTPPLSRSGWLSLSGWEKHAQTLMSTFDVRARDASVPVATLSGGNQQKAVIARELSGNPPVIVAVNPTRGLDIGAANAVLARLLAARDAGAAVLMVHSDLDELLTVSDRILVLHDGRLSDSHWPAEDRSAIGRLMVGAS